LLLLRRSAGHWVCANQRPKLTLIVSFAVPCHVFFNRDKSVWDLHHMLLSHPVRRIARPQGAALRSTAPTTNNKG
jgi:hypothetical protein